MTPSLLEAIGILANIFLATAYFPQIYKTIRTKKAGDISVMTWSMYCIGEILLLIYALATGDLILILTPAMFALGDIVIVILTLKYRVAKNT